MARKDGNGVKHSKKSNKKENKKFNPYSQKTARMKEELLLKKKKLPLPPVPKETPKDT